MPNRKLAGIQFARGMAALLVVLYHSGRMLALPQYVSYVPLGGLFNFGNAGVDFFFTLSGFIIFFVHQSDIGRPARLLRYAWRRVTRIYPNYWLVTAMILALALAKGGASGLGAGYVIKSVLLLPQTVDPILGVGWTLVHEMLFYTVFGIAIVSRRLGIFVVALWLLLVIAGAFTNLMQPLVHFAASFYHIEFLIGAAVAYIVLTFDLPHGRFLALAGAIAFLGAGLLEDHWGPLLNGPVNKIVFGICSGAILLGTACAERRGELKVGRIGEFFGGASYSVYLVHTIVIGFTGQLLMRAGAIKEMPGSLTLLIATLFSVSAGMLLCHFIEMPVTKALNNFGQNRVYGSRRQSTA